MSLRNSRELRTIAESLDLIIKGRPVQAADILIQRFKAVEHSHNTGTWQGAKYLELIPPSKITVLGEQEREIISKMERQDTGRVIP